VQINMNMNVTLSSRVATLSLFGFFGLQADRVSSKRLGRCNSWVYDVDRDGWCPIPGWNLGVGQTIVRGMNDLEIKVVE
jgi:hypothetical protein